MYFDLNERVEKYTLEDPPEPQENSPKKGKLSLPYQLFIYFGTFLGVLFSTAVHHFEQGGTLTFPLGEVATSAVIALVIVPLVYEKLRLNPKAPLIVQFGLFVQNGVFWHVLINSLELL